MVERDGLFIREGLCVFFRLYLEEMVSCWYSLGRSKLLWKFAEELIQERYLRILDLTWVTEIEIDS